MKTDEYLQMINSQLLESKANLELIEKSFREAKAKYETLLNSKESYIKWVMDDEVNFKTR